MITKDNVCETPTNELVSELSRLEKQIDLMILKYNLINSELISRFPFLEKQSEFQPKVLKKELK